VTYEGLAARFRVRLCPGGDTFNHEQGQYDQYRGIIHWRPRRVTKPGLRRFLKLVMTSMLGLAFFKEPEKTYWAAAGAEDLARQLHVRFPRHYADLDRARVREALPGANLDKETRRMIERWAR